MASDEHSDGTVPTFDESIPQINPTLKKKVQKLVDSSTSDEDYVLSLRDLYARMFDASF
jgi:hypothetical protein